ncbi:MAG: septum site-determining protein MinC [Rhodoferax sp.]
MNSFEIKSAQWPLVSLLPKTGNLQQVALDLLAQYGPGSDNADFFDHDALLLDFSRLTGPVAVAEVKALLVKLSACHLQAVAFRGCQADQIEVLQALGLVEAPVDVFRSSIVPAAGPDAVTPQPVDREVVHQVVHEVPGPTAMIIDKPVRSGQKIYARGTDLVLLAIVNQGAEVVADGNIHVYAPLRGKAMAGASGNTAARIFSICLEPELISIAGVYRTSENPLAADIQGKPAQVRLSDDGQEKLLFEPLNT